jgi:hypothetical protein
VRASPTVVKGEELRFFLYKLRTGWSEIAWSGLRDGCCAGWLDYAARGNGDGRGAGGDISLKLFKIWMTQAPLRDAIISTSHSILRRLKYGSLCAPYSH